MDKNDKQVCDIANVFESLEKGRAFRVNGQWSDSQGIGEERVRIVYSYDLNRDLLKCNNNNRHKDFHIQSYLHQSTPSTNNQPITNVTHILSHHNNHPHSHTHTHTHNQPITPPGQHNHYH